MRLRRRKRLSAQLIANWTLKNASFVADNRGEMIAVLMLGLLWMALARLTDEPTALAHDGVDASLQIAAEVAVASPRFRLGDIATIECADPQLRERLRQLELGASPLPGQVRLFTRAQLITRLRQHNIEPRTLHIEMPDAVRIRRIAQALDLTQLERYAREQLVQAAGEAAREWTLENPPAPTAIPEGAVEFQLVGAPRVAHGSALLEVVVLVEGQPRARYLLRFRMPNKPRQLTVRSGDTVQVRVVCDGVVLEVRGVARASGALDETVPVYIPDTQKTLRAQVIDTGLVEVRL